VKVVVVGDGAVGKTVCIANRSRERRMRTCSEIVSISPSNAARADATPK
jgi:GTPase SAR1 family protein